MENMNVFERGDMEVPTREEVDKILADLPEKDRKFLEEYHEYLRRDDLTETYVRKGLLEEISKLAKQPRLKQVAVIMGDVNGLKQLNDDLGHNGADEVLRAVGGVLKPNDIVGRYGGDEFLLLLPVYGDVEGFNDEVLERRIEELGERVSEVVDEIKHRIGGEWPQKRGEDAGTMSFGGEILPVGKFLEIVDGGGDVINELVGKADERMYMEKNGRK